MENHSNGVIRIGRKGVKKFAFGTDGAPFEVDVVSAFQAWLTIDDEFREAHADHKIPWSQMPDYNAAAVGFVQQVSGGQTVTPAEALDFLARLREQYDEVAAFFRPKSLDAQESQDSSAVELEFSAEES